MARKKEYLFDIIPRWVLYSGLPGYLNRKYGQQAWSIFSCLISIDCRFNPDKPDWFDQSFEEIAELTGLSRNTVSKYVKVFEKDRIISLVKGKFKGHKSSFKITNSVPTPKDPNSIRSINGGLLGKKGKSPNLRYYQRVKDVNALEDNTKDANQIAKGSKVEIKGCKVCATKRMIKRSKEKYKGESTKQEQVVSSLSQQREETPLPTKQLQRERSKRFIRELRERLKQKDNSVFIFDTPEIKHRKRVILELAKREKRN